jgi:hypothetical protein
MVQLILVKVTVHLALHIVTTERRECDASPGMMCAEVREVKGAGVG